MWKRATIRHGSQFIRHVVPAVMKPARVLWNEIIGFVFLCFGVIFGFKAVQLYRDYTGQPADSGGAFIRLILAAGFTLVMLYFGLTSFLRARKISRS